MTALPTKYKWLDKEPGPKMFKEMLGIFGTLETPGSSSNPKILQWAKEINVGSQYSSDAIPWCGLAMGVVAHRAGKKLPNTPLWALSWADWGNHSPTPMLGDVLVFKRNGGGHVSMYVGEDNFSYHILGGNQGDRVCIERKSKADLFAARNSYITTPSNCRVIKLSSSGTPLSKKVV